MKAFITSGPIAFAIDDITTCRPGIKMCHYDDDDYSADAASDDDDDIEDCRLQHISPPLPP